MAPPRARSEARRLEAPAALASTHRQTVAEWPRLLRQSTTQGRAVLQQVMRGRITVTPQGEGHEFEAPTQGDKLFTGSVVPVPPLIDPTDRTGKGAHRPRRHLGRELRSVDGAGLRERGYVPTGLTRDGNAGISVGIDLAKKPTARPARLSMLVESAMKNAIRIASWLTVATTVVSTAAQTRPDFSGVWKWVTAPKPASPPDLPPGAPPLPDSPAPPKHISTTIVQSATEMKVEYRSERAGREDVLTWVYKLDRSESVNMVGGALYKTTAAWKGDALVLTSTVPMEGQPDWRITDVYRIENGDLVIENTTVNFRRTYSGKRLYRKE